MGIFDSALQSDAQFAFGDTDSIGAESATYRPKTGTTRAIKVVVNRNLPVEFDAQGVARYSILVFVQNSATKGISATELDSGSDRISVPFREGGTAQTFSLGVPESQDAGGMTFRLYGTSR